VEGPCRSTTDFKEIGEWCNFVLEPVIFDQRMTAFVKEGCGLILPLKRALNLRQSCIEYYSNPSFS